MQTLKNHRHGVAVLGIYVADLAFRAARLPGVGETVAGSGFAIGPGGKGSNQAVAAARAGARVTLLSKIGRDTFGETALALWAKEGIVARVTQLDDGTTGAAFIYVNDRTGENAIIVVAGAAETIGVADIDAMADAIRGAHVFMTQLEQPAAAALRGLQIARAAGTLTIFNPAPAIAFDDGIYPLCDYLTPNEHEASLLTGLKVTCLDEARRAGDVLLARGVGHALITLGAQGALLHGRNSSVHIAPRNAGLVIDTTGAGDAFNGGFAAALAEGANALEAAHFASAVAAISVTRSGTALSMPLRHEIDALLGATA